MPVQGKSKGNSFERKISNLFSERFKEITGIEKSFKRNSDSGSFFGGTNQYRTKTHDLDHANFGDLICPNNFKFSVECKHYKSGPTFAAIVKGKIAQWDAWLKQAQQDASNSKKEIMLIVKYNAVDDIVFLAEESQALQLVMPYRGFFVYKLADVLTLPDRTFFILD